MPWFTGQSALPLLLAFSLGLLLGYLIWRSGRRPRGLTEPDADTADRTGGGPRTTGQVGASAGAAAGAAGSAVPAAGAEVADPDEERHAALLARIEDCEAERGRLQRVLDERDADLVRVQRHVEALTAEAAVAEGLRRQLALAETEALESEGLRVRVDAMQARLDAAVAERDELRAARAAEAESLGAIRGFVARRPVGDAAEADGHPDRHLDGPADGDREAQAMVAGLTAPEADEDLTRVEGIGPRMHTALQAAGISTYVALARAGQADLHAAIRAAGLRFAPSLPTWPKQAAFLATGDDAGFTAYTDRLVAGRDEG